MNRSELRESPMYTKYEESIRALIMLLDDHLDNSEYEDASKVAKTLLRVEKELSRSKKGKRYNG